MANASERISQADNLTAIRFKENAVVSTPPAGYVQVYFDTSGMLNWKDDAGTIYSFAQPPLIGTVNDTVVERDGALSPLWIKAYENTTNSNTAYLILQRSRGSKASPAAVQSGDQLGVVSFRGYGTSFSGTRAAIVGAASQLWTGSAHGTQLVFQTTPNGSTSLAAALILHNDKRMEGFGERSFKDAAVVGYTGSDHVEKQAAVQTTDATVTTILTVTMADGEGLILRGEVMGLRSTFAEAIGATFFAVFRRTGGAVVLVGTADIVVKEDSAGAPTVTVDVTAAAARVRVTGEAAKTINWVATYHYHKTLTNA